jgi:hypothetical protein
VLFGGYLVVIKYHKVLVTIWCSDRCIFLPRAYLISSYFANNVLKKVMRVLNTSIGVQVQVANILWWSDLVPLGNNFIGQFSAWSHSVEVPLFLPVLFLNATTVLQKSYNRLEQHFKYTIVMFLWVCPHQASEKLALVGIEPTTSADALRETAMYATWVHNTRNTNSGTF